MKCVDAGTLRAYLDSELPSSTMHDLSVHLDGCSGCSAIVRELAETAEMVKAKLSGSAASAPAPALALLERRIVGANGNVPRARAIGPGILKARGWLWAAATAAVLALVIGLAPINLAAEDLLSVFRVRTFAAVTIDPSQLPAMPKLANIIDPRQVVSPDFIEVTGDAAAQSVDFTIKRPAYLPSSLAATGTFASRPFDSSFTLKLRELQDAATRAGVADVQFPPSLDGATLRVNVPAAVFTVFGSANTATTGTQLILAQTRGPAVEVPDSVDVAALREQVLAMPLLPPEVAKQLRAIKDWRHTLIIPVRAGTHKDVTVAGVPGLLISHSSTDNTLLWQKDGVLYGLSGSLSSSELMRIAASLRQ